MSQANQDYRATSAKIKNGAVVEYEAPVNLVGAVQIGGSIRIGAFTYIIGPARIGRVRSIGRYCSIAPGVNAGPSDHPTEWMSTSPFQYSKRKFAFSSWHDEFEFVSRTRKNDSAKALAAVSIGNDVWIGAGATILNGASIGDGAIVAAGSVVTKPVPPYAIVGGIPAKVIRMRFPDSLIRRFMELRWWRFHPMSLSGLPFDVPEKALELLASRIERDAIVEMQPEFKTMV